MVDVKSRGEDWHGVTRCGIDFGHLHGDGTANFDGTFGGLVSRTAVASNARRR